MNLYLISQTDKRGYDTYSEAIVCADTIETAKRIYPNVKEYIWDEVCEKWKYHPDCYMTVLEEYPCPQPNDWARHINLVEVKLLGVASSEISPGVILASYHAG